MADLTFKQGEKKIIELQVKNADGTAADLSEATMFFGVKKNKSDLTYAFSKVNADFDVSQADEGILAFSLLAADSNLAPSSQLMPRLAWTGLLLIWFWFY